MKNGNRRIVRRCPAACAVRGKELFNMVKKTVSLTILLFCGFLGAVLSGAEPCPVWDYDFSPGGTNAPETELLLSGGAVQKDGMILSVKGSVIRTKDPAAFRSRVREGSSLRQIGVALSFRFDELSAADGEVFDFGFFRMHLTRDGFLCAEFLPERDEIRVTPLTMVSRKKIEPGKWYDLAMNFTAERQRCSMYLNGIWQMDNAVPLILERVRRNPVDIRNFTGAIRRFTVYDMAMNSEELTPSDLAPDALNALEVRAEKLSASANPALAAWGGVLTARLREIPELQKVRKASMARVNRIVKELDNAEKLSEAAGPDKKFVVYHVNPTSQEMYLPDHLPQDGRVTSSLRFFAAKGENTFGSVVIAPLQPVEKFTVRFTPFRSASGAEIPEDRIDAKLVKCWFRTGGAWMTYHADKLTRILTPDLLLNDDSILRVDEYRQSNERYLELPEGARYVDCSRRGQDMHESNVQGRYLCAPFHDAETLQPITFETAGRTQQYLFTFQIPETQEPGFYSGKLELVSDGKVADSLTVTFRVLPFVLPQPKTYYDIGRTYFSHINLCSYPKSLSVKT